MKSETAEGEQTGLAPKWWVGLRLPSVASLKCGCPQLDIVGATMPVSRSRVSKVRA